MLEEDKTIDILAERLQSTKLPNGVSFAGEGLKLNTAEDAKEIVDAINSCETLEYLNLEGNTIGVDAAEAISKALEKQPGFKRALWKDMFTGRLKEEIPKALKALCRGVMVANAQLEVLDLSDNASGPIGVDGIAEFIKSPACYTLKQLILNNMGLGVTGAEMLSKALLECCEKSEREGRPLKLKVFIAGRNRLEDDGIKALSQVFKKMGSLEEILIPQNGIRSNGIKALSEALSHNISLRVLNLNDNTLGIPGSKALADGLRKVRDLRSLDIGDCLTKTNGALAIAEMLSTANNIKDVILSSNCITTSGALIVLEALDGKNLSLINLDGNKFGEEGIKAVTKKAQEIGGNKNILTPIEEDEGSEIDDDDEECIGDDDEDVEEDEDYDEEDETDSMYEDDEEPEEVSEEEIEEKIKRDIRNVSVVVEEQTLPSILPKERKETVTAAEFIADPTVENLMGLGRSPGSKIIEEIKKKTDDDNMIVEELISVTMLVSSLFKSAESQSRKKLQIVDEYKVALDCADSLYKELFQIAIRSNCLSTVNNILPVFLGLIKCEKKNTRKYNQENCIKTVKEAMKKDYFPVETSQLLEFVMANKPLATKEK